MEFDVIKQIKIMSLQFSAAFIDMLCYNIEGKEKIRFISISGGAVIGPAARINGQTNGS